ncbi:hypothetical protein LY76DRAFT_637475 [Colletotrichum caudatum]|nr:hypothetical protein LY76DRAFT_637475 [Colletotrichum caudatum]
MARIMLTHVCALTQAVTALGPDEDDLSAFEMASKAASGFLARHITANFGGKRGDLPSPARVGAVCKLLPFLGTLPYPINEGEERPEHSGDKKMAAFPYHYHVVDLAIFVATRVPNPHRIHEAVGAGHGSPRVVSFQTVKTSNVGTGVCDATVRRVKHKERDEAAAPTGVRSSTCTRHGQPPRPLRESRRSSWCEVYESYAGVFESIGGSIHL